MKTYIYILGDDPYKNGHGEQEGNGEWHTTATNVEEALRVIFSGLAFPAEPTGRKFFLEGVSLPGVPETEVIQVWSNEPDIVRRTHRNKRLTKEGGLHTGRGHDLGLHLEVKVTDIENYLTPVRALLAAPESPEEVNAGPISPMGANLLKFDEAKDDMRLAIQKEQVNLMRRRWEIGEVSENLEDKMREMRQQMAVLDTYLHGTRHRTVLCSGKRGSGKYSVFQNRQYLSEEIALLGNFQDFDFQNIEGLDKWLVESGAIWKFLPHERCILATRIRKEDKDYGDPLANLINNMANMQNMIWIRDGENVCHVDVEFNFHNAVFPDKDQFERALRVCQDYVWKHRFKTETERKNWHGQVLKPGDYDVMGEMRRKPLEEEDPYYTRRNLLKRFDTLQEWLDSEYYNVTLDKQIREEVMDYLRVVNKKQMIFAVLLQGVVDHTQLLDIPKGTDLFSWESIDQYFTLLNDYTHALPWNGVSNKIQPYLDGKVKVSEWIVAYVDEYIQPPPDRRFADGTRYKERNPILFQVVALKDGKPVVNYHPMSTRRKPGESWGERSRNKGAIRLVLNKSSFIRVPMPPSLAEQILEDRGWKKMNQWAVPLMVNYKRILETLKARKNAAEITWEKNE
jgi:hypothetical protein